MHIIYVLESFGFCARTLYRSLWGFRALLLPPLCRVNHRIVRENTVIELNLAGSEIELPEAFKPPKTARGPPHDVSQKYPHVPRASPRGPERR